MRTGVFWIRDGVLMQTMALNAAGFAVASLVHGNPLMIGEASVAALVNFAFEKSGVSCAEKMRAFNDQVINLVPDVSSAVAYYNLVVEEARRHCQYFSGARKLVRRLSEAATLNFITSAVDQSVLKQWLLNRQGQGVAPSLIEALGQRSGFIKGRDHFYYVRERYGLERIIYVADAVNEIRTGAKLAAEFNITPVGFAHVVTVQQVREAYDLVVRAHATLSQKHGKAKIAHQPPCASELWFPDQAALVQSLQEAGAADVITGSTIKMFPNLARWFENQGVL